MPTTPINALRYPQGTYSPNLAQFFQDLATDTDSRLNSRHTTTTARDAAITAPVDGQVAVVAGKPYLRTGGVWQGLPKAVTGGTVTLTTSGTGDVLIAHTLGVIPTAVSVIMAGAGTSAAQFGKASIGALTTANIPVRINDTRDGITLNGFSVTLIWTAFLL